MKNKVFVAYPSEPYQIGRTIEQAAAKANERQLAQVLTWKEMDVSGRFLIDKVLDHIDEATFIMADITTLNFNVTYEIGYAIGKQKRIIPIVNKSLTGSVKEIAQLGIFDTIGYSEYENADDLIRLLGKISDVAPLRLPAAQIDRSAPIYVLDTLNKTDASIRILSKIKKAHIKFRSFDPREVPRLSSHEAYHQVANSIAVVVHLVSSRSKDYINNNQRGAFLAGLARGLDVETLILQEGDESVPLDYRDFVQVYKHPRDVDKHIHALASRVMEGLQEIEHSAASTSSGLLEKLDLGSPAAENEASTLGQYYVQTDEFNQTLSGAVRIAVGRKGSGKTALFLQVRDRIRSDKRNIILDLKPDGHQLQRLKYQVLNLLQSAVKEHVAAAFWEYLLYLEICRMILLKDREVHRRDPRLYDMYQEISRLYAGDSDSSFEDVDFSERMLQLVERLSIDFDEKYGKDQVQYLRTNEVTELIYRHDIPNLRSALLAYLSRKKSVWILFDNIDKGWPTRGVEETDVLILRALMEATRKVERIFSQKGIAARTVVFVRNDVYELLVDESPDRGKESKVSLDWTDRELLAEFLRKRVVFSGAIEAGSFDEAWTRISAPYLDGERTYDYLINRSLMRPRNLLSLVNHCKSIAVNLGHAKITSDDIKKACDVYSADIGNEIGLEIRDVFPQADDILYYFIDKPAFLSIPQLKLVLAETEIPASDWMKLMEVLLWFSFLGVVGDDGEQVTYIYDVYYDMKKLKRLAKGLKNDSGQLGIHPAFWPFLNIRG